MNFRVLIRDLLEMKDISTRVYGGQSEDLDARHRAMCTVADGAPRMIVGGRSIEAVGAFETVAVYDELAVD